MKTTESIWFDYHSKLYSFIKGRTDENVAEDILQDVFIKIHTGIDSLKETSRIESWLFKITRNAIVDYYRARKVTAALPDGLEAEQSAEKDSMRKEFYACIMPMISRLPEKYRTAVLLSEIEGKPQKVIAAKENISLSGAKSRVQRGRAMLKSMIYDCCQIELNHKNQLISCRKK
ncbi:RNA polymerase sigma factor SigZ [Lentisphaerota bacterium ZTH]|nr:RNA polymerase sigma factor SigZ [Lentisphaerota bacterium]WET05382.1 RNA polymerase sigma factor SigZ [Lentisphaerota bacterium ZTH]